MILASILGIRFKSFHQIDQTSDLSGHHPGPDREKVAILVIFHGSKRVGFPVLKRDEI